MPPSQYSTLDKQNNLHSLKGVHKMSFIKSWFFWAYLTACFVISAMVFGPVASTITLGVIAITSGLAFLVWWMSGQIVAGLASNAMFFIKARQGCGAVVMLGGHPAKFFLWVEGKRLDPSGDGEVIDGEFPKSFWYRLYGYEWMGIYPQNKRLEWQLKWEKTDGVKIIDVPIETIYLHYHTYLYGMTIPDVEDSAKTLIEYGLGVQLETTNLRKTLFATSANPGDWIKKVKLGIFSALRDFTGQKGRTFDSINEMQTGSLDESGQFSEFQRRLFGVSDVIIDKDGRKQEGIKQSVGQIVKDVRLVYLKAPPEYIAGKLRIKTAEQKTAEQRAAAPGIVAEGKALAKVEKARLEAVAAGEKAMLEARANGYGAIALAGDGAGAAMFAAEELSKLNTLVLGQNAGISVIPDNSKKNEKTTEDKPKQ